LTAVVQDQVPPYPASGRLGGVIRGLLVKEPANRMSVGIAHQAMLRLATDSSSLVTHAWKPPTRAPGLLQVDMVRPPQWAAPPPVLPPPPSAGGGAASLRPLPIAFPSRTRSRKMLLVVIAVLVAAVAAVAGYSGARAIAYLENGGPVATLGSAVISAPVRADLPS